MVIVYQTTAPRLFLPQKGLYLLQQELRCDFCRFNLKIHKTKPPFDPIKPGFRGKVQGRASMDISVFSPDSGAKRRFFLWNMSV
jgi:hypothetical protein